MNIFDGTTGGNLVESTSGIISANAQSVVNTLHTLTNAQVIQAIPLSIRPKQGIVYPRNTE